MLPTPWKVSLHGGHSGQFCEHAESTLREILEAAVNIGYSTFGVSEHAPRQDPRFLYSSELAKGYNIDLLFSQFDAYAHQCRLLQKEFTDRLHVLCGFETEVVPSTSYIESMLTLQREYGFDYMVGSVHHVNEIPIDYTPREFTAAVESCDGLESFCERYYHLVCEMIEALQPEVVAHLDLVRRYAPKGANLATPRIRKAAESAIQAARNHNCILDINTAGWRKDLGSPYPETWLVQLAIEAGLPFCFGDDSHKPADVGYRIDEARRYLLDQGVKSIMTLQKHNEVVTRHQLPLNV